MYEGVGCLGGKCAYWRERVCVIVDNEVGGLFWKYAVLDSFFVQKYNNKRFVLNTT